VTGKVETIAVLSKAFEIVLVHNVVFMIYYLAVLAVSQFAL
jgi:hypothetical protein